MKKWMKFVVALLAAVVTVGIWWVDRTKPEIRYTISEPIRFGGEDVAKILQQIKIQNSGNAVAKDVLFKAKDIEIETYELLPNSKSDDVEVSSEGRSFEVAYKNLPPQGEFVVTLTALEKGIAATNVKVVHSQGVGKEAFDKGGSYVLSIGAAWIWACVTIGWIYFFIWSWIIWNAEHNAKRHGKERVLSRTKPWLVGENRWQTIRKDALDYLFDHGPWDDTEKSSAYHTLCGERWKHVSDEEWATICRKAEDRLAGQITDRICWADCSMCLRLAKLEKPRYMNDGKWTKLREKIEMGYYEAIDQRYRGVSEVARVLEEEKPECLDETRWAKWRDKWMREYCDALENKIKMSDDPLSEIQEDDLRVLPQEMRGKLREYAYDRMKRRLPDLGELENAKAFLDNSQPEWLREEDYKRYKRTAINTIELDQKRDKREKELEQLAKDRQSLEKDRKMYNRVTKKAVRQLEIINGVLADESVVDKIEDYEDVFAPGNLENLRRLARAARAERT